MSRTHRPRSALVATVVACALVLGGCGWWGSDEPTAPAADASPAPVVAPDPDVEVLGAAEGEEVEVGEGRSATDPGSGVYFVSSLYDLSGPGVTQPVLVRMVLQSAVPQGTPLAVATRTSEAAPWTFVEGRLDSDGRHVEFILAEVSPGGADYGVLAIEAGAVRERLVAALDAALARDARAPRAVEAPVCEGSAAALEDEYAARSWKRETVGWCLDKLGDERMLRVTNLRGVPVRISAPGAADRGLTGDTARAGVPWTTWLETLAPGQDGDGEGDSDGSGATDRYLVPGRTLTIGADLDPGTSLLVTATDDPRDRAVQVLHALAVALSEQVEAAGLGSPDVGPLLAAWTGTRACARALDAVEVRGGQALASGCLGERSLRSGVDTLALLLRPVLDSQALRREVATRLTTLAEAAPDLEQRIEITREEPDFGALVGGFTGSDRTLRIAADGTTTESYGTEDGPVIVLTYRLSDPAQSGRGAGSTLSATATITAVQVLDRREVAGAVPRVGQVGTISLSRGIVTPPFLMTSYCDAKRVARCTEAPTTTSDTAGDPQRP